MPKNEWPPGSERDIIIDFEGEQGDRRQELVLIGQFGKDSGSSKQALEEVLDTCLLTDDEFEVYKTTAAKKNPELLKELYFPSK